MQENLPLLALKLTCKEFLFRNVVISFFVTACDARKNRSYKQVDSQFFLKIKLSLLLLCGVINFLFHTLARFLCPSNGTELARANGNPYDSEVLPFKLVIFFVLLDVFSFQLRKNLSIIFEPFGDNCKHLKQNTFYAHAIAWTDPKRSISKKIYIL